MQSTVMVKMFQDRTSFILNRSPKKATSESSTDALLHFQTLPFFTCCRRNPKSVLTAPHQQAKDLHPPNSIIKSENTIMIHNYTFFSSFLDRETDNTCKFQLEIEIMFDPNAEGVDSELVPSSTMFDPNAEGVDSELVPSSLASIAPILRVANEIEKDNGRVAYLCRFHAFEEAHRMDPKNSGRGARQFKTYLIHRLQKEEESTKPQLAKNDPKEIQKFYQNFYEKNIREGQYKNKPEEMAKIYQIATVLYDVVRTVVPPSKVEPETQQYAKDVEENKEQYEHYNILPLLYAVGNKPAIMSDKATGARASLGKTRRTIAICCAIIVVILVVSSLLSAIL